MNIFEKELRRIASACAGIKNPVFAGRACYGDLGGENRVKLQFVTIGHADHYEALNATVLNRLDGTVDTLLFRFEDIWGKKQVSKPGFSSGIVPHIWKYNQEHDWYAYVPTNTDIKQLAAEVNAYIEVFADHSLAPEKTRDETAKKKPAQKAEQPPQSKGPPTLLDELDDAKAEAASRSAAPKEKPQAKKRGKREV